MAYPDTGKELMNVTLSDPAKLGHLTYPSKGEEDPLVNINKGIEKNIGDLEARYATPNWFKVSAGFLKPQLGGFGASLGSAFDAMGENVEQQKALQIPLFKMRTELATNAALLNRGRDVQSEISAWYADPKNKNKLPPAGLVQDWRARGGTDLAGNKSISTQIENQQKQQELAGQQNQQVLQRIENQRSIAKERFNRGQITPDQYDSILNKLDSESANLNTLVSGSSNYNWTPNNGGGGGGSGAGVGTSAGTSSSSVTNSKPTASSSNVVSPNQSPMANRLANTPTPTQQSSYSPIVVLPVPSGQPEAVYNNIVKARTEEAKRFEDKTDTLVSNYEIANRPDYFNNYKSAMASIQNIHDTDKEAYVAIHNLLRKSSPLAAAAQKGIALNFGNLGANISIPVTDYQRAKLPEKYWGTADRLISNYATLANAHMKMDNIDKIDPSRADDLSLVNKYAHLQKTPDEAYYHVNDNHADFEMRAEIAKVLPSLVAKINKEHPNELAPLTAAYRSQEVKDIQQKYASIREMERKMHAEGQRRSREYRQQQRGG
jgi:hypothetical protein